MQDELRRKAARLLREPDDLWTWSEMEEAQGVIRELIEALDTERGKVGQTSPLCAKHPRYRAMREPRADCATCRKAFKKKA